MAKYIEREALIEWLKHIPLIDLSDGRGLCRVIMEQSHRELFPFAFCIHCGQALEWEK